MLLLYDFRKVTPSYVVGQRWPLEACMQNTPASIYSWCAVPAASPTAPWRCRWWDRRRAAPRPLPPSTARRPRRRRWRRRARRTSRPGWRPPRKQCTPPPVAPNCLAISWAWRCCCCCPRARIKIFTSLRHLLHAGLIVKDLSLNVILLVMFFFQCLCFSFLSDLATMRMRICDIWKRSVKFSSFSPRGLLKFSVML